MRVVFIIGLAALIVGGTIAYRIYTKPHRDVSLEKGLAITAQELMEAFVADETAANAKYLDKAIELSGEIAEITSNQEGNTVVNVKTKDAFFVVNCSFKTNPPALTVGQTIQFKGICTGYVPNDKIVINEGVLVK